MNNYFLLSLFSALACIVPCSVRAQSSTTLRSEVKSRVDREYPGLFDLYKHFHSHPELSFQEENTSVRLAEELRKAGYEVTPGVGKYGVVAVFRNGTGPTVLVRSDMDGLPVKEQTGLPYASEVITKDGEGHDVPVMHACGHDCHMACLVGTARVLMALKDQWHGTLVLIGQPAEEKVGGARAMLADGLFRRFPVPKICLALHDDAEIPAGTIGYTPGYAMANVDSVDITVHGVGGHGAYPHKTKDPIVLASEIVLTLQTIVAREVQPGDPAVVTVGSVHGGTKHNIIPDEVRLQLTVRSYTDEVRRQLLEAIQRIIRGQALAAGIPEDRLPEMKVEDQSCPATYNDPDLTAKIINVFKAWFGDQDVIRKQPSMGAEDFSEYGRTAEKVPILMFNIGGVHPKTFMESKGSGKTLPSLHSPLWAPLPEPTIKTGVTAMTAAVLELMQGTN
jgi:hippurate hydrolase